MKKIIAVLISFSLFFTMLISSAFAQDPDPEMEALQKMSFTELVDYMNADPPEEESEETVGFAYLLQTRMNEVSAETIEAIILDPQNCDALRTALMMLAADLSWPLDADKLTAMVRGGSASETLKAYALSYLIEQDPVDRELFSEIASDKTDPNSGWALKLLYLYDEKAARPIIDEVLANCSGLPLDGRTGTALLYKGVDLYWDGTAEEVNTFIKFCDSLLAESADESDTDAVILALSNVGRKESVSYIFTHCAGQSTYLAWAVNGTTPAVLYELYDAAEDSAAFAALMRQAYHPLRGDIDGDNRVTAEDARLALRQSVGLENKSKDYEWDMNGDLKLTPEDARLALRTAVGLIKPEFAELPRGKAGLPVPHDPVPIDDYVLVCMTHEYSFPKEPYPPEYFHAEYVEKVETLFDYHEGDLVNKEKFIRIEKLDLTEKGKDNIDDFIAELNAREDILSAERDYLYYLTLD